MPLLFKMQKTLINFSLPVILKVRILDIPTLSRDTKGHLVSQTFMECGNIRTKFTTEFTNSEFPPMKTWKKDKVQVPQRKQMLSLHCTGIGKKMKNINLKKNNKIHKTHKMWVKF